MTEAGILSSIDRLELIDGEVIDLPPIGALHSAIVDCLVKHFGRSVDESVVVRCQNPIRLDDSSDSEPDIALLRQWADGTMLAHPGSEDVLVVWGNFRDIGFQGFKSEIGRYDSGPQVFPYSYNITDTQINSPTLEFSLLSRICG